MFDGCFALGASVAFFGRYGVVKGVGHDEYAVCSDDELVALFADLVVADIRWWGEGWEVQALGLREVLEVFRREDVAVLPGGIFCR